MYDVGRVTHMNPVLAWLLALSLLTACGQPGTPVSPPPPRTPPPPPPPRNPSLRLPPPVRREAPGTPLRPDRLPPPAVFG